MDECMGSSLTTSLNQTQSPVNDPFESSGLVKFRNEFSKIHGPLSLAVCTFGIPANLLNIIVLTRRELAQTATNHLLLWLAFADLLLMIMYAPCLYHFFILHPHPMKPPIYTPSKLWITYHEIFTSCSLMFHSLALWLAVILALFRYIHVGFPVIGSVYTTRKRAFLSAVLTTICCIFITIPNVLVNHIRSCHGPVFNPNSYNSVYHVDTLNKSDVQIYYFISSDPYDAETDSNKSDPNAYHQSTSEHSNYSSLSSPPSITFQHSLKFRAPSKRLHTFNVWLQSIASKIAPPFLLTILTILLIGELQKAIRRRRALFRNRDKSQFKTVKVPAPPSGVGGGDLKKNHQRQSMPFIHNSSTISSYSNDEGKKLTRENRTTALLLTIVIFFLVIELPQGILVICLHLIENFEENVYQHVGDLLDFLTLLNESISFVIYTTMSHQFRKTFYNTFCPLLHNKINQSQENTLNRSQHQHSQQQQQQQKNQHQHLHQQQQQEQHYSDQSLSTKQKIDQRSCDNEKSEKRINFSENFRSKNDTDNSNNSDKTLSNNTVITHSSICT
ncbi:unnamed protein product [Trichobilharzia szidati]|nr:unnamed protein product [Trichobilharzia szidati]